MTASDKSNFSSLAKRIQDNACFLPVKLVAVDGPAGSGKSTFAKALSQTLNCPVIPLDDFLTWHSLTDFWPRLEEQLLKPLLSGKTARYQRRDWEGDPLGASLGAWLEVKPAPILILEGVGSSRKQISGRLACAIWVESSSELCLSRGIARDGEAMRGNWSHWQEMERAFFTEDGARDRAHLVVSGEGNQAPDGSNFFLLGARMPFEGLE